MKNLVKVTAASLVLALATASFAFVEKRPAGATFTPEQSQEQVEQQQALSGQYGVLGSEDLVQPKPDVKMAGENPKANDVLIMSTPSAKSAADRALIQAEQEVGRAPRHKTSLAIWGFAFLIFGVVAVWAFKSYADKVVPEMPTTPKAKTKW